MSRRCRTRPSAAAVTSVAQSGFQYRYRSAVAGQLGSALLHDRRQVAAHPYHRTSAPAARCRCRFAGRSQQPDGSASIFPAAWLGRSSAQCRVRQQSAVLQSVRHRAAGAQRHGTGNIVTSLSATATATSLTGGAPAAVVYRRLDAVHRRDHLERLGDHRPCRPHRRQSGAGRRAIGPGGLCANTAAGDPTRPNFMLNQLTTAVLTYSPTPGSAPRRRPTGHAPRLYEPDRQPAGPGGEPAPIFSRDRTRL